MVNIAPCNSHNIGGVSDIYETLFLSRPPRHLAPLFCRDLEIRIVALGAGKEGVEACFEMLLNF